MSREQSPDVQDPEMKRVVADEERVLKRVLENASVTRERTHHDYDKELLELRDAINEARMEDVPALIAEMERVRRIADRRAEVVIGTVNLANPYFGHMRLEEEGGRARDVLIGNSTYVDADRGVRIVDWRDAPVSRIYYRYSEGDDYEEEIAGRTAEGRVTVRRAVVIQSGNIRRIVAPQGVYSRDKEGRWSRGHEVAAKLSGGQLTAVRPPTDEERRDAARARGRLGVGVDGREDHHLPEIPALIDPRQFELISKPSSGLVVIQGGAGSGKTTIGLHRMAYLAFNNPKRYTPDRMLVIVFNRALASYIVRVLPSLGVEGVSVMTFGAWAEKQRQRHVPRAPGEYSDDTPPTVARLKKHPLMLRLIDERVAREESECLADLTRVAARNDREEDFTNAWKALRGQALSRKVSGLMQWLRGERELGGTRGDAMGPRAVSDIQHTLDRWMRRARDVVWDWAELTTDAKTLLDGVERFAPGQFSSEEVHAVVRWCSEHVARWATVDRDTEGSDDEDGGAERTASPRGERRKPRGRKRDRDEDAYRPRIGDEDIEAEDYQAADAAEEARNERRDDARGEPGDDDAVAPSDAPDVIADEVDEPTLDPEDDALLVRLYQVKRGPLRGGAKLPLRYEHLFVDEAQDLSPVELAVLMDVTSEDHSVTLAGDTAQRLHMDNGFTDWQGVLRDLGLEAVKVEPLRIGYRSTMEVLAFARAVLGPLADPEAPLATRHGAPVEFHGFGDVGAAVAFLGEALRMLAIHESRSNVAVIARDPERADVYFAGLERAEVPRLKRVKDQDFSFRPGVEVTDVRQVKGLEFDYVVLVDVTASQYPVDDESRHLLHIGATRAAHQLWIVATGTPSALLPGYMLDEA